MARRADPYDPERLQCSPEVSWYLKARGFGVPTCPPLVATPEPNTVPGARFDPDRVDKVINVFRALRHTQGPLAGRPLEPDPWQVAYILAPIFGWVKANATGGYSRIIREVWVEMSRKNGKGLYTGEVILTADGWKKFGDLVVGDYVHAVDGSLTRVSYVSPVHELDCYRVTFADGQSVICDADHRWTVHDRRGRPMVGGWTTISTPRLAATFAIGRPGATATVGDKVYPKREFRYRVRMDRVLERPTVDLPFDPYLLGVWLGDGTATAAMISTKDPEILEAFRSAGYLVSDKVPGSNCDYRIRGATRAGSLLYPLRALGVLGSKHVPECYLLASAEQRMALLRGLMDTDGSVNTGPNTPRVEFVSTKHELADAVLFLARSLGWKASISESRARLNGRDMGPRWRVGWTAYWERSPFALARKTDKLNNEPIDTTRAITNSIVNVERVSTVPTKCIQVEHESHQFLAGEGLIPTHNTSMAGAIAIYLTAADGESGAQVLAAATTKDQANFCFAPIKLLAERSPQLKKNVKAYSSKIVHPRTGSTFTAISHAADAQHGANIHGAICDEIHLMKSADLIEAIETGTGSRSQPLIFMITTADTGSPNTVYERKRKRVEQLADGALKDPTTFGVIWAAARSERELTEDPFSPAVQRRANPGYGISPTAEYLERAALKARENTAELGTYLRLHLGVRTRQVARFVQLADWDASAGMVDETSLDGRQCFGGLDLSSVDDVTALCWLFPDREHDAITAIWRLWVPEDRLIQLNRRTANGAEAWVRSGHLRLTPGNVIDNEAIISQIDRDAARFDVKTIGYDRWGATDVVRRLGERGMTCVGVGQGFATLSSPTKELLRLVLLRRFTHGGNPAMRWMIDNLAVATDPAGQVKPNKKDAADKIDGVSAAITALSEVLDDQAQPDILDSVF